MVFLCKGKLASRHKLPCFIDSRSLTVRAGGPSGALCSSLQLDLYTFTVPTFTGLLVLRTAQREIRRQGHSELTQKTPWSFRQPS